MGFSELFNEAYEANYRIFRKNPGGFRIIVCHSQGEFRKESKYYYKKWATATVLRNGNLVIKSPCIKSRWKRSDYPGIIRHEMCHVFWTRLYRTTKPVWLAEGTACHVGRNFSGYNLKKLAKETRISNSILHYRYIRKKLTGHVPFYPVWQGFTDYLISRNGSRKIVDFIGKYSMKPDKETYDKAFQNAFGASEKQVFNGFLKSLIR